MIYIFMRRVLVIKSKKEPISILEEVREHWRKDKNLVFAC